MDEVQVGTVGSILRAMAMLGGEELARGVMGTDLSFRCVSGCCMQGKNGNWEAARRCLQ